MKKIIIVIAIVLVIVILGITGYNSIVSAKVTVDQKMADINTQLQRRADLIPNLVNTVKGYAAHEEEIFTQVTNARQALLSAGTVDQKAAANDQLTSALGRLLAIAEAYPDLKANTAYISLMDELSGTENRISVARQDYNNAVKEYNQKITTFPGSMYASLFGFKDATYFEAAPGSQTVPEVKF